VIFLTVTYVPYSVGFKVLSAVTMKSDIVCDATQSGRNLLTFRNKLLYLSSGSKS
jgi:hypothetical protein